MRILFPQDSYDDRSPDEAFVREFEAAKAAGLDTTLVDTNSLRHPTLKLRKTSPGELLIYRGWMLTPSDYEALYRAAWKLGYRMINTPSEYRYCHELPRCYADLKGSTPESVWFESKLTFEERLDAEKPAYDLEAITTEVQAKLGEGPYIIKDFVKSRKHEWDSACFIAGPGDIKRVAETFIERQGEFLVGGLVFRKFEPLKLVGEHPKSKIPLFNEIRNWGCRGGPLITHTYWGPDEGGGGIVMPHGVISLATLRGEASMNTPTIKSNFYTMDLAMLDDGNWIIIELGDGQVAGLPEHVDAKDFYTQLKVRFH